MKVSDKLRFAYLTKAQAVQMGMPATKYDQLVKIKYQLEDKYKIAGGQAINVKKAILNGKGNADGLVPRTGLSGIGDTQAENRITKIDQITIHEAGRISGEGVNQGVVSRFMALRAGNGLGEPASGAAIAAASGIIAAIGGLLKSLGSLFPGGIKKKGSSTPENYTDLPEEVNLDDVSLADLGISTTDVATPRNGNDALSEEEKKKKEAEAKKKKTKKILLWGGGATVLGIGGFFLYKHMKNKSNKGNMSL